MVMLIPPSRRIGILTVPNWDAPRIADTIKPNFLVILKILPLELRVLGGIDRRNSSVSRLSCPSRNDSPEGLK